MKKSASPQPARPAWLLILLYGFSGFCFLSFETIWIRTLSNQMGGTAFSSAVIISVFFAFAACGNLWAGRRARAHADPIRAYGFCELATALSAALCFSLRPLLETLTAGAIEASAIRHFAYAAAILAVPSFFSGATFPFLSQALIAHAAQRTASAGPVYAANLIGAALGVFFGGICLPRLTGYSLSFYLLAALLAACGLAAVRSKTLRSLPASAAAPSAEEQPTVSQSWAGPAIVIASGVLSLLVEILSFAYARQFTAQSMYSMAAVLFAFIVNFGIGSALAARLARRRSTEPLLAWMLTVTGFLCAAYSLAFHLALQASLPVVAVNSAAHVAALALGTTLLLAPLHVPAGMVFPLAWTLCRRSAAHQGEALGQIVAFNKAGSALGAFAGPFLLFPLIGLPGTLIVAGACYLLLALVLTQALAGARPRVLRPAILASLIACAALFATRRPPANVPANSTLLAAYEGADGIVAVTQDAAGSRHIIVNNSYVLNGTEKALQSQKQESWLPLALSKNPQRAAFIGMASGISAAAALDFPLAQLDAIELIPEVVHAAEKHFGNWNSALFTDPRASIRINDGRYVIQASPQPYDVVICDLMFKEQEGTSSLYSRDFFQRIRAQLATDGKFCLWLPLYQLDKELCCIIIRTFLDVFPNAIAIRGNLDPFQSTLGLIGSSAPIDLSSEFLSQQLESSTLQKLRGECPFFRSLANLRLLLVGDLRAVSADFANFEVNSDEHPVIAFKGPRVIANGELLRGFTFLNFFGQRFLKPDYPSCRLGQTPPAELLTGIRAGNHLYAASTSAVPLPVSPEKQLERTRQTLQHLETAARLSPRSDLQQAELGQ
ncbi:MAG TPA: fused MFS/spermidine synthase [Planctomycetota bacterium]|nr:fused MFS/spermidine synthase [Planctomycetota bacterium]